MNRLNSNKLTACFEAIERIHSITDIDAFYAGVLEVAEDLFEGSFIVAQEFDPRTKTAQSCTNRPAPAGVIERCAELIPLEHPVFPLVAQGCRRVLKLSDFCTQRQFRRTALYSEIFRPLDVRYELVLPLPVPNHVAGLTISRDRDFSDDEIEIARLITPHVALARVRTQEIAALRKGRIDVIPSIERVVSYGLTRREAEVLHWIMQGKRDGEIAQILDISRRTVEKHVQSIIAKLGVETRTGAAMEAIHRGTRAGRSLA